VLLLLILLVCAQPSCVVVAAADVEDDDHDGIGPLPPLLQRLPDSRTTKLLQIVYHRRNDFPPHPSLHRFLVVGSSSMTVDDRHRRF